MTQTTSRVVSVADTAKILRKRLKLEFPETRFSVRSKRYAGGGSISVRWSDGPLMSDVKAVTDQYEGSGFDPMIDLKYGREHWLRADGTVMVRHSTGTTGSMGTVPATDNRALDDVMPADAERVRFAADYVLVHRELTNRAQRQQEAEAWVYDHCVVDRAGAVPNPHADRFGNQSVAQVGAVLLSNQRPEDDLPAAYRRAFKIARTEEET